MTPAVLRSWLMRQPRPTYLVADEQRIDVPNIPRPWPQILETLLAMKPTKIVLHAQAGAIIRARDCEWSEDGSEESTPAAEGKGKSDLQVFAALLADAYDKGSKSYSPLLDSCMQFLERQGQMLAIKDKEIAQLRAHNTKLQAELLAATVAPTENEEVGVMGILAAGLQAHAAEQALQQQTAPAPQNGRKTKANA